MVITLLARAAEFAEREKHSVALVSTEYKRQCKAFAADPKNNPPPEQPAAIQNNGKLRSLHATNAFVREHLMAAYECFENFADHHKAKIEPEVAALIKRDKEDSEAIGVPVPASFRLQVLCAELARIDELKMKLEKLRGELSVLLKQDHAIGRYTWPKGSHTVDECIDLIRTGKLKASKSSRKAPSAEVTK